MEEWKLIIDNNIIESKKQNYRKGSRRQAGEGILDNQLGMAVRTSLLRIS